MKEAGRAAMPVPGILGARGKTGLAKRVIRDSWGPSILRGTQVVHRKQGFRAWERDWRLEVGICEFYPHGGGKEATDQDESPMRV